MRLLVILDRQHAGKPGRGPGEARPEDMGAAMRTPDGRVAHEADLVMEYITEARAVLEAEGAQVRVIDPLTEPPRMSYGARQERAKWWARQSPGSKVAYVACHLNAGHGDYAILGHDPRSQDGRAVAEHVADALDLTVPVLSRIRVEALTGKWARGLPCIEGIYSGPANLCGMLYEPLFVDHPSHQHYIQTGGLRDVGACLARGIIAWARAAGETP